MTRQSRERRAVACEGGQAAARAAASPPHYEADEERRFEEVVYLHSLCRSGPSAPAGDPAPPAGVSRATRARADQRKRRRIERAAEAEYGGPDWSLAPAPTAPSSWPNSTPVSPAPRPQQQPSTASLAQRDALRAAEEFFSRRGASGEDCNEVEGPESEDSWDEVAGFFLGLFERDAALRGYYERSHREGEFVCMACVGRNVKKGRARRFRDCISLVRHAHAATRVGRPQAHRALAAAVCRVLGWDVKRLPGIVIDPRGRLGQALLAREGASAAAAAATHEDNADAGQNGHKDAAKEDVGLEKMGSLNDDRKEDVDKGKICPPSNNNDGEVHEQGNSRGIAEKEGDIGNKQEHGKSADDMGGTCNVRLENNSSKMEEAATENKEEHTEGVLDFGDDIGNLGRNLMDSSKS
ncbi:uncharacterized protein LOC125520128 isoform X2 [Triticum urartu]|nr:uncharacterized protein LOC125520128 isoform X2 [Triticum urartu]